MRDDDRDNEHVEAVLDDGAGGIGVRGEGDVEVEGGVIDVDAGHWGVEVVGEDAGGESNGGDAAVEARPWGTMATLMWTVLGLIGAAVVGMVLIAVYVVWVGASVGWDREALEGAISIPVFLLLSCLGMVVLIPMAVLLAKVRGVGVGEYLGWRGFSLWQVLRLGVPLVAYVGLMQVVASGQEGNSLVDESLEAQLMAQLAEPLQFAMLAIAVAVLAPVVEEVYFRGFMLWGIARSRAGEKWGLVLSSGVWAVIHVQYSPAVMLLIFGAGLYLGWVRLKTGSVPLCIVLHMIWNGIAVVLIWRAVFVVGDV